MNIKKEIIFSIITSLIGSAVTYFITTLGTTNVPLTIALNIAIFALAIFIINFQQPILLMFAKPGHWQVGKNWVSCWVYIKDSEEVTVRDKIELNQIGSYLYGKGCSIKIKGDFPFETTSYKLKGRINAEGIINGEWENTNKCRNYYGAFILRCSRNGKQMAGHWMGIGNNEIHTGTWNWNHISFFEEDNQNDD